MTLTVLTGAVSVLIAFQITIGYRNAVGLGIESQSLTFIDTGIANGEIIK